MERQFETTPAFAQELDTMDKLAKFHKRFYQVKDHIYMDGNSAI